MTHAATKPTREPRTPFTGHCTIVLSSGAFVPAQWRDISRVGIGVAAKDALPAGQMVGVLFESPATPGRAQLLPAQVCWLRRRHNGWDAGLRLQRIDAGATAAFAALLHGARASVNKADRITVRETAPSEELPEAGQAPPRLERAV